MQLMALYLMPEHFVAGIISTFFLVVIISYGFELYSLLSKKGHYEVLDAIAGIVGGIIGMATVLLFSLIF